MLSLARNGSTPFGSLKVMGTSSAAPSPNSAMTSVAAVGHHGLARYRSRREPNASVATGAQETRRWTVGPDLAGQPLELGPFRLDSVAGRKPETELVVRVPRDQMDVHVRDLLSRSLAVGDIDAHRLNR